LLASVLGPGALWLHRKLRIRWTLACVTVIFLLLVLNLLITFVVARSITHMLNVLPQPNSEKQLNLYKDIYRKIADISPFPLDPELFPPNPTSIDQIPVFQRLTDFVERTWPDTLRHVVWYSGSWLWQWILIMFILLFLLLEGRMLMRRTVEIFGPSEEVRAQAAHVLSDIAAQVRTYLVWRTIINFGLAIVVGVVYQCVGLQQAWMWAIFLAILNYVPYLGPIVAGVPPVIDAFLSVSGAGAVGVLIFYVAIIIVEGYLIVPLVMGRSMDMNATTVMLACLFWELLWGPLGLFLAMPLMAAVKAICYHVEGWRPWANLMSTSEEVPRPVTLDGSNGNGPNGQFQPASEPGVPVHDKPEENVPAVRWQAVLAIGIGIVGPVAAVLMLF
jgi:predicted PurR-regulated permease PerM